MIRDEDFVRGAVPMTKEEVRCIALVKAGLEPASLVLDVGAGTGSISIEAAKVATEGKVFALEKNPEAIRLIHTNMEKFAVSNMVVIENMAPHGMEDLPPLDVVFVGGSGGELGGILSAAHEKLKPLGRLVIMSVTVETLSKSAQWLSGHAIYDYEIVELAVSRYQKVGGYHMKKAFNPVSIIVGTKKERLDLIIENEPWNEQAVS